MPSTITDTSTQTSTQLAVSPIRARVQIHRYLAPRNVKGRDGKVRRVRGYVYDAELSKGLGGIQVGSEKELKRLVERIAGVVNG